MASKSARAAEAASRARRLVSLAARAAAPIDFVATGLIGGTKIDEAVICGRLDGPSTARIGSVSWRVPLREFEIGKGGASCR